MVGSSVPVNLDTIEIYSKPQSWMNDCSGACVLNGVSLPAAFTYNMGDVVELSVFKGALTCIKNNAQVDLVSFAFAVLLSSR